MLERSPFKDHVSIHHEPYRDNSVGLWDFAAKPKGEGWGSNFLRVICNEASRQGVTLRISAMNEKLVSYYGRFGFVPDRPGSYRLNRQP